MEEPLDNNNEIEKIIGMDISRVRAEIEKFASSGLEVENSLSNLEKDFFDGLAENWASPNAVKFSQINQLRMSNCRKNFELLMQQKIDIVNDAARTMAEVNGETWNDVDNPFASYSTSGAQSDADRKLCLESLNGVTGMAIEAVKLLTDVFRTQMNNVFRIVESMPREISLYSTDGSIANSYETGIEKFETELKDTFNTLCKNIDEQIEIEINKIQLAKTQAMESINSIQ